MSLSGLILLALIVSAAGNRLLLPGTKPLLAPKRSTRSLDFVWSLRHHDRSTGNRLDCQSTFYLTKPTQQLALRRPTNFVGAPLISSFKNLIVFDSFGSFHYNTTRCSYWTVVFWWGFEGSWQCSFCHESLERAFSSVKKLRSLLQVLKVITFKSVSTHQNTS